MFKITFNKPAVKMFFQGEDAHGIKIKVENGNILFKPCGEDQANDLDVVPIMDKVRGGAEAKIEGSRSGELLALLTNPLGNPYYLLNRASGGWMEAVPHTGPRYAPERWEPHIRVWPLEDAPAADTAETTLRAPLPAEEQIRETLTELEAVVSGMAKLSHGRAYASAQRAQNLLKEYFAVCAQHPLPNQKTRKERTAKINTAPMGGIYRSRQERAFSVSL